MENRSIPSRSQIRDILDALNLLTFIELLECCYGLSLIDQYWIKEKESPVTWKDVNFFTNDFSEDM